MKFSSEEEPSESLFAEAEREEEPIGMTDGDEGRFVANVPGVGDETEDRVVGVAGLALLGEGDLEPGLEPGLPLKDKLSITARDLLILSSSDKGFFGGSLGST